MDSNSKKFTKVVANQNSTRAKTGLFWVHDKLQYFSQFVSLC